MEIYGKQFEVLDFDEIKGTCFGFIYVTVNNVTGKRYLGLHNSWKKGYLGSGHYIKSAIKKYGKENFTRYIIDTAGSYTELVNLEAYYITEAFGINLAESDDWYNITSGLQRGGNTWAGMSEADRRKRAKNLSKAFKGKHHSEEQIEANRKATSERMKDPKERQKVAKATKAAMANPELRKRLSEAKKGTTLSKEHRRKLSENIKRQYKVTLGDTVKVFSGREAVMGYLDIGRKIVDKLVKTGEVYQGKLKRLHGLSIERVN